MPRLSYFDFPGGRGEDCRIALHIAGVAFEDHRVKGSEWREIKGSTPFGGLPVYREDDGREIGQSNAILSYLGRQHGLLPSDPVEAAQHEAILQAMEDLRWKLAPSGSIKDPAEKQAAREAIKEGYLQDWARSLTKQIRGPFFGGDALSVADLKIFVGLNFFLGGACDHIGPEAFEGHPKLMALHAAVKAHPGVVGWYSRG